MNMNAGYLKRVFRVKIGFIMNFQLIEILRFYSRVQGFLKAYPNKA